MHSIAAARFPLLLWTALFAAPAVHALDTSREDVRDFIGKMSREHQFDSGELKTLFRQVESKKSILDAMSKPAERSVPWFEYRERFMTEQRLTKGAAFGQRHAAGLDKLKASGAPVGEILGILGVETMFGEVVGKHRVIDALSTLAFDYPPRRDFFIGELEQFLLLSREQNIRPEQAVGSYAGAMGPPQFMPSSYRNYAVDGDGDGKRDLWTDWDDVLASIANYLAQFGWRSGEPVMADADLSAADMSSFAIIGSGRGIALSESVGSLRKKGVKFDTTLPDDAPALVFTLQGRDGPVYRVGFNNFYVITRYNRSTMYAAAVNELGQALVSELTKTASAAKPN